MGKMVRIAVFASGNGSNAENIIEYLRTQATPAHAEVACVVCNKPGAGVIERARRLGVPCRVMSAAEIRDEALMGGVMDEEAIDMVVLAGFLMMVPPFLVERYRGRMLNIHPSLLPKFGGKGMYGRHVHEAVVAAGERETGITIHHVSEECDGGSVIFQASVAVAPSDTPASVEAKVHTLERLHFPRIVAETAARIAM